jgi:GntR family transcriptional regulator
MFELDPRAPTPLSNQLADRLRFLIATGHFRPGDRLPSTRDLGKRLKVSFHTVRKGYGILADEGRITSRPGAGYVVAPGEAPVLSERLERGAEIVHDAVQRLVGLGFSEDEIAHIVDEQLAYIEIDVGRPKLVFAAPYRELAEAGAAQVRSAANEYAQPVLLHELENHPDSDVVAVPHGMYQQTAQALPQAQVVGVSIQIDPNVLAEVSRLLPVQTLGLVTRYGDAIGPLLRALRAEAGFSGPSLALESDVERERIIDLIDRVDLLVFTSQTRRRLRGLIDSARAVELTFQVAGSSLDAVVVALRR